MLGWLLICRAPRQSNILVPHFRFGLDEFFHEGDALRVLSDVEIYSLRAEVVFRALEGFVFADDDLWDSVEQDRSAAHRAGREGGVNRAAVVNGGGEASGVFEAIHFGVVDDAAVLHPAVVSASDDLAVEHKHGADGNSTLGQAFEGFFNCRF